MTSEKMYAFFYPENDQQLPGEFKTADEAIEHWRDRRWVWKEIEPRKEGDLAAFINLTYGGIVVLREIAIETD